MRGWLTFPLTFFSLSVGLASCSASSDGSDDALQSPWPGFTRIEGLGARCTASAATAPEDVHGALQFIPCSSGMAGCEELRFDAAFLRPGLSGFDFAVAFDPLGVASRLLVVHRGALDDPRAQLPVEAVVYEIATGAPTLVWRNAGDAPEEGVYNSNPRHCLITPAISNDHVSALAAPSGSNQLSVGRIAHSAPMAPLAFRETVADLSSITRPLATDQIVAAIQDDGLIHRFAFDGSADVSTYGPAVKLRLTHVVDGDVYGADNPGQTYQLASDGPFVPAPSEMRQFKAVGAWAAWVERAATPSTSYDLWIGQYSSDLNQLEGGKQFLAQVSEPRGIAFGDGWVAVMEAAPGCSVSAFELSTGAKRTAKVDPNGPFCGPWPLAVVGNYVWVAQSAVIGGFAALQRYTLTPG